MSRSTLNDLSNRAERAIEREEEVAFDTAVEYGQMFANVAHMQWFKRAVMQEIADTTTKYAHLADSVPDLKPLPLRR